MPFKTNLAWEIVDATNWRLTKDLIYVANNGVEYTVLTGYISDGESGSDLVKSLFIKHNNYRQQAAMLHDSAYQAQIGEEFANKLYLEALLSLPVDKEDAQQLYDAVHSFGEEAYELDQKDVDKIHAAQNHLRITLK